MRELILKDIEFYKSYDNFSKSLMRWKAFYINHIHISEYDFNLLTDEELLAVFSRIIRKHYSQM